MKGSQNKMLKMDKILYSTIPNIYHYMNGYYNTIEISNNK